MCGLQAAELHEIYVCIHIRTYMAEEDLNQRTVHKSRIRTSFMTPSLCTDQYRNGGTGDHQERRNYGETSQTAQQDLFLTPQVRPIRALSIG